MRCAIAASVVALLFAAPAAMSRPDDHAFTSCEAGHQSTKPPYKLEVVCHADCRHRPKPLSTSEIASGGIDPKIAVAIDKIRLVYWHKSCDRKKPTK